MEVNGGNREINLCNVEVNVGNKEVNGGVLIMVMWRLMETIGRLM